MSDPILRDFPNSFETERLTIRSPLPGDGPELRRALVDSIDALRPWMPWAQTVPSEAGAEANMRHAWVEFLARRDLRLNLIRKSDGIMVGSSGLHRIDWAAGRFEIGYWCRTPYVGNGYITEAVRGITRFAFDHLGARRIEIRCDSTNLRSRRIPERLGFHFDTKLVNFATLPDGTLSDSLVFSLTDNALPWETA